MEVYSLVMYQNTGQGISSLSNTQLEDVIGEIEQAIEWHQSWYRNLLRSLIADIPADDQDLSDMLIIFVALGNGSINFLSRP